MSQLPLQINRLCKSYGPTPAVCGVEIAMEPGEILTLLGPSGCGKTTTLRLVAGFEHPDAGEILIDGKMVAGPGSWVPPEKRGVGMVFQDYALFPHLTVTENIGFGLSKMPAAARSQRVTQMLRLVGLDDLGARYPHNLSGGQQQRVALARALAPRPALVLLDEPFSNLDAHLRVQMREDIRRIFKESGAAAIFVTHDQKDALALSDRVAVMNGGKIEQVGSPREIYQFPHTTFVARFVGQTNLLFGEISLHHEHTVITEIGPIPCIHNHGLPRGTGVTLSVRPDSFHVDPQGTLKGRVKRLTYTGNAIEVAVETQGAGAGIPLCLYAHPAENLQIGQVIGFQVRPDFVAVVEGNPPCADIFAHL